MHQHTETPGISSRGGNMPRPLGSQSSQQPTTQRTAEVDCDETDLLALLKRLGLALSPTAKDAGPGGNGSSSSSKGSGSGSGHTTDQQPIETPTQPTLARNNGFHPLSGSHHHHNHQQQEGSAGIGAPSHSTPQQQPQQQQQQQQQHQEYVHSNTDISGGFDSGTDRDKLHRELGGEHRQSAASNNFHRNGITSGSSNVRAAVTSIAPVGRDSSSSLQLNPNEPATAPTVAAGRSDPGNGRATGGGMVVDGSAEEAAGVFREAAQKSLSEARVGLAQRSTAAAAAATQDGDVDLMRREITAREALLLVPILWAATGVTCLKLCYNHLKDGGAEAVSSAIERHPSLHTLDLGFNGICDQGAASLAGSLGRNRSLRTLYLSGNSIGPAGARALANALARNSELTTLHLSGNCIGPDGASALAEALKANTCLTRLYIDGAGIKARGACAVASALVVNSVLSDLHMSDNEIGDKGLDGLAHALRRNKSVRLLELCFNRITAAGAEVLAKALWGCTTLRSLRLGNNQVGDRGAQALASALPTLRLETLELGFNNVATSGVAALMQATVNSPTFTALSLSGNALDAEAAKAIQAALAQPRCALRRLSLDHTSLGKASEGFIANGVLSNRCLALMNLTGFQLGAAFARLGMPSQVEKFSNEQALEQVRLYWANHLNLAAAGGRAGGSGATETAGTRAGDLKTLSRAAGVAAAAAPPPAAEVSHGGRVGGGSDVPLEAGGKARRPRQQQLHIPPHTPRAAGERGGGGGHAVVGTKSHPLSQEQQQRRRQEQQHPRQLPSNTNNYPRSARAGAGDGKDNAAGAAVEERFSGDGGDKAGGRMHRVSNEAPVPPSVMKSPRIGAGAGVATRQKTMPVHSMAPKVGGSGGGSTGGSAGESFRGSAHHRPLVQALHQIAQLPFSAAELWTLHQYYFSPPTDPHCTAATAGAASSPHPATASTDAKRRTKNAGAECGTGWLDGCGSINGREREGCDAGPSVLAPLGEGSAGGGRGFGTGLVGGVDVHRDDGVGAGARRCRRSSSLGGNEDDDEVDSPRPPSKRYRNSSTKTRIAFFPSLQTRIRALRSKPDERGVLTILRQLKFLQTHGSEASAVAPSGGEAASNRAGADRAGGVFAAGRTGGGAAPDGSPTTSELKGVPMDEEIEKIILEEL